MYLDHNCAKWSEKFVMDHRSQIALETHVMWTSQDKKKTMNVSIKKSRTFLFYIGFKYFLLIEIW